MNAIYARANDGEGEELRAQIERCSQQAKLQGRQISPESIYTDAGGWRLDDSRVGLQALSGDIREGKIDRVYVDALDRLGRSIDVAQMIDDWRHQGAAVVVVPNEGTAKRKATMHQHLMSRGEENGKT